MTTRDEIAALPDSALDEAIATKLMGWKQIPDGESDAWERLHPGIWRNQQSDYAYHLPHYSQNMSLAWQVVQRIVRIPQSLDEAKVAPNTRFMYAFERAAMTLCCSSEAEAARWICEQALAAWESGPLFPEESEVAG